MADASLVDDRFQLEFVASFFVVFFFGLLVYYSM